MISANGGLPAHRYTPQVTPIWPGGSEPASILATHLTWRYKGNKSESWDHFEGPYLRASVRKGNKEGRVASALVSTEFRKHQTPLVCTHAR